MSNGYNGALKTISLGKMIASLAIASMIGKHGPLGDHHHPEKQHPPVN